MPILADDIIKVLPHRYPFLMVDRVLELEPGRRAVAVKTLSADALFSGHSGVLTSPEMLVIEAMAQVGAVAYAFSRNTPPGQNAAGDDTGGAAISGYLAGLNDVVFHARPRIGDTVELALEYVAALGTLARFRGTASVEGNVVVEAGLTFTVEVQQ